MKLEITSTQSPGGAPQIVNAKADADGNLKITLATDIAGENGPLQRLMVLPKYNYTNITAAAPTTTTIKTGPGILHAVIINASAATGVITIYDNTAASGNKIATITTPASVVESQYVLLYDVEFLVGLTVVTSTAAQDITISHL